MGGSSGTGAIASTGSGGASSRTGRIEPGGPGFGGLARARRRVGADRGQHRDGALRQMALEGCQAAKTGEAETVAERSTRAASSLSSAPPLAPLVTAMRQGDLRRRQHLGDRRGEHHVLDAEAGIDGAELLLEETREMADIAARPGGADGGALDGAVDAVAGELEAARPCSFRGETLAEVFDEPPQRPRQILGRRDRLGEGEARAAGRHRTKRRDRLARHADRLVEAQRHDVSETLRQRGTRHLVEIADALEAEPVEPAPRPRAAGAAPTTGNPASAARAPPGGMTVAALEPKRATAQAAPEVSAMAARPAKPRPARRAEDIVEKSSLATTQMGAAGDVERGCRRRRRAPSTGYSGRTIRRAGAVPRHRPRIGVEHAKAGQEGLGIGERQAGRDAGRDRLRTRGRDEPAIADGDGGDEGADPLTLPSPVNGRGFRFVAP